MTEVFSYKTIARWESRGGKYWVELLLDHMGYTYNSDNGGGVFPQDWTEEQAMVRCTEIASFAPSKMKLVE
jgi:hypothetical protein